MAVATGDMSMLQPLSVKDAIWLEVERWLREKRRIEEERTRYEFFDRRFEMLYYMVMDCREVVRNMDYFTQIAALKEAKHPKFEFFPYDKLPSVKVEKEREKAEKEREEMERRKAGIVTPQKSREERLREIREAEKREQSDLVKKSFNFMARIKAIHQVAGDGEDTNITLEGVPTPPSRQLPQ